MSGVEEVLAIAAGAIAVAGTTYAVGAGIYKAVNRARKPQARIYRAWREIEKNNLQHELKTKLADRNIDYRDIKALGASPISLYRIYKAPKDKRMSLLKTWGKFSWAKARAWFKIVGSPFVGDVLKITKKVKVPGKAGGIISSIGDIVDTVKKIDKKAIEIETKLDKILPKTQAFSDIHDMADSTKRYKTFKGLITTLAKNGIDIAGDKDQKFLHGQKMVRLAGLRESLTPSRVKKITSGEELLESMSALLKGNAKAWDNANVNADSDYVSLTVDGNTVVLASEKAAKRESGKFRVAEESLRVKQALASGFSLGEELTKLNPEEKDKMLRTWQQSMSNVKAKKVGVDAKCKELSSELGQKLREHRKEIAILARIIGVDPNTTPLIEQAKKLKAKEDRLVSHIDGMRGDDFDKFDRLKDAMDELQKNVLPKIQHLEQLQHTQQELSQVDLMAQQQFKEATKTLPRSISEHEDMAYLLKNANAVVATIPTQRPKLAAKIPSSAAPRVINDAQRDRLLTKREAVVTQEKRTIAKSKVRFAVSLKVPSVLAGAKWEECLRKISKSFGSDCSFEYLETNRDKVAIKQGNKVIANVHRHLDSDYTSISPNLALGSDSMTTIKSSVIAAAKNFGEDAFAKAKVVKKKDISPDENAFSASLLSSVKKSIRHDLGPG